jgi:hypothetical protein
MDRAMFIPLFKEHSMESRSRVRPIRNGESTNLLLFPEESFASAEGSPLLYAQRQSGRSPLSHPGLSLTHITAEWPALLKRLGRRRQVLETILTPGRPIQLIGQTLIIEFPLDRRFHRELLDIPDYRAYVEEELSRRFRVRLAVATSLYPENRRLRPSGGFGSTPA